MNIVAWVDAEDLVEDGYSHTFTARNNQPSAGAEWVGLVLASDLQRAEDLLTAIAEVPGVSQDEIPQMIADYRRGV